MEIHIHYCDFGGVAVLSNDKLKTLPAKFRTLAKQAISAKLSGKLMIKFSKVDCDFNSF